MPATHTIKATDLPVHSVTVFQADRAEVNRLVPVELKEGPNEVEIVQLPTVLDQDSIRVDGIGNAIIVDVIYHPPRLNDSDKKHQEAVKDLSRKRQVFEEEKAILAQQASVLEKYSSSLTATDATAEKLEEFMDVFVKQKTHLDAETRALVEKIEGVEKEIEAEKKAWSVDDESKARAARVTVVVTATEAGAAELSLTYMVTRASWTPQYDLRATVEEKKTSISLHYRATISQRTGEDWKDVSLVLSTASPQLGSTIPKLSAQYIGKLPTHRYGNMSMKSGSLGGGARSSVLPAPSFAPGGTTDMRVQLDGAPAFFEQAEARPVEGVVSTSFVIESLATIPSNTDKSTQAHKVTIAVIDLSADLQWVSVPKEAPSAFLQAKVKNTSQFLLLPGNANIFLENNFVAKSTIPHVSPNETFPCSLGVDQQVRVTYHPRSKMVKSQGGLLTTRTETTTHTQRITVKNTRTAPLPRLIIRDQIPVSSDERIKIVLLEPKELPGVGMDGTKTRRGGSSVNLSKDVPVAKGIRARWFTKDDEEVETETTSGADTPQGIVEWISEFDAGRSADISMVWEMTAPVSLNWGPL